MEHGCGVGFVGGHIGLFLGGKDFGDGVEVEGVVGAGGLLEVERIVILLFGEEDVPVLYDANDVDISVGQMGRSCGCSVGFACPLFRRW